LYARLKRCGDLSCTGRPFTEHRNVPALVIKARDRRPAWQQVTETFAEAIESGSLAPGDELPSIIELSASQGIGTGVIRKAVEALAADGLIIVRHGRASVIAGEPSGDPRLTRRRPGSGHDCQLAGCRQHVCHPMKAQHDPRHPQHLVRRVRRGAAVGMDRPQPHNDSEAAHYDPSAHLGDLAG
jgi:DNA-binding transcriptional regulator YhcF (GntR family)